MPYQGLIFAAVLGVGLALAIGVFIASTQWEQPQAYGEDTRRRRRGYNNNNCNRRGSQNYEQVTCPICQDSLLCSTVSLHTLRCRHKYHMGCIQRWFIEQSANGGNHCCPVCREPAKM